jgi:hypothetical protein
MKARLADLIARDQQVLRQTPSLAPIAWLKRPIVPMSDVERAILKDRGGRA